MKDAEKEAKSRWNAAKSALDDAKDASQSFNSRGTLYASLMKQKDVGNISGICVILYNQLLGTFRKSRCYTRQV